MAQGSGGVSLVRIEEECLGDPQEAAELSSALRETEPRAFPELQTSGLGFAEEIEGQCLEPALSDRQGVAIGPETSMETLDSSAVQRPEELQRSPQLLGTTASAFEIGQPAASSLDTTPLLAVIEDCAASSGKFPSILL